MKPQYTVLPLAIALALSPAAQASGGAQATELDTIVVTATRTELNAIDSNVPVQVIDREVIERSQATSLLDLLRGRAGMDFANQGGAGKLSSMFLRGTESDHVLVLVDGVRIGSATAGMTSFQDLPLEQIERIEVVRGPRSSLYGAEAIGGVVQIFTRHPVEGPLQGNFSMGAGNNGFRSASAGIGKRSGRSWFQLQGAWQRTDGINACRGTAAGWGAGCFVDEPDRDGYRNASVSLRGGGEVSDTLEVEGHALLADAFNEYDGSIFGGNEADNRQQVLGTRLKWRPRANVDIDLRAGRSDDRALTRFHDPVDDSRNFASRINTRRFTASAQGDVAIGDDQVLSVGIDWMRDEVEASTAYVEDRRDNTAGFVAWQGRFDAHAFEASLRHDDNEQFGGHSTASVGYGFSFADGWRLTASAGTGYKTPTFNDLYYPVYGNADLQPEESRTINLGLAHQGPDSGWTFNVFQTRIDELIGYDTGFALLNVDESRIRGAELTAHATLAGWELGAELSHIDPRNLSPGPNQDRLLPRRARDNGRVDVDRALGDFRIGASVLGSGARYDDAANTVRLGGFATVDLRLEYAINDEWTLQARASNLFDRDYETIAWFNQPGREYGLTLRYRPAR